MYVYLSIENWHNRQLKQLSENHIVHPSSSSDGLMLASADLSLVQNNKNSCTILQSYN